MGHPAFNVGRVVLFRPTRSVNDRHEVAIGHHDLFAIIDLAYQRGLKNMGRWTILCADLSQLWNGLDQDPLPASVSLQIGRIGLADAVVCTSFDKYPASEIDVFDKLLVQIIEAEASTFEQSGPHEIVSDKSL